MLHLHIVIASTRPGRVGESIARWFLEFARENGGVFQAELVDLAEVGLPVFDEPHHPRQRKYVNAHTLRWSASVNKADAFVFVMPEYNHFPPPSLVNALNYVYQEWNYKPCGFVAYGGASGGMRAVESIKPLVTTLKMMPMVEAVHVHGVSALMKDGAFSAQASHDKAAHGMLTELEKWAGALKSLRTPE